MEAKDMILICKALSDTNRLEIVQMLSDGEKCGCKILDKFNITQPTLSHHMKILVNCGIGKVGNERRMQKAEYRYYEISQDLPVMALSGKKWEYLFVDVEEILKEVL